MLPIFGMILAGIIGYAVATSKKSDQKKLLGPEPQKALSPIELIVGPPKFVKRTTGHKRPAKVQKSLDDLLMAAVRHSFVTKDPRDYRAAAMLAAKSGKPESAKVLAEQADTRAKAIAMEAKDTLEIARSSRDPRHFDRYASLVEQIDQGDLARKARAQATVLRSGRAGSGTSAALRFAGSRTA